MYDSEYIAVRLWRHLPVIVRAVLTGGAAAPAGALPWSFLVPANVKHWPARTSASRRILSRANSLPPGVRGPALLAGIPGNRFGRPSSADHEPPCHASPPTESGCAADSHGDGPCLDYYGEPAHPADGSGCFVLAGCRGVSRYAGRDPLGIDGTEKCGICPSYPAQPDPECGKLMTIDCYRVHRCFDSRN